MRFLALVCFLAACGVEIGGGEIREADPPAPSSGGGDQPDDPPIPSQKLAIVLAHGLAGSVNSFDPSIVTAIEARGHAVKRTAVPGVDSVAARAAALGTQIDAWLATTGATRVHIIAHSMGGLDARYAISKLGYAIKVASLTTISTPHRGSPLADVALGIVQSPLLSQSDAYDAVLDLVGAANAAAVNRALVDLSVRQAATFNASVTDAPGVRYFSYAGFSTINGSANDNATACGTTPPGETPSLLLLVQPVVGNGSARIPSDAVVSIPSATWGQFAGCIAADHLSENGPATETFDSPAFYKSVVTKLEAL